MNKKWIFLQLLLLIPITNAIDSNYNVIVEENGNALVIVELDGQGLVSTPLQEDVTDVRVKGALYTLNNNSIDISIGSTEKAIFLYKTSLLTTKQEGVWNLALTLIGTQNEKVTIAFPKEATIIETKPQALIESLNYTKLMWEEDIEKIEVNYKFQETKIIMPENIEPKVNNFSWMISLILIIILLVMFIKILTIKKPKETPKKSNQQNVIKTLSKNESLVVNILMQRKGEMKRNKLEKISKLAKSSLANTLNNLERKKIIGIDKTYTTHYIKFTRWFNEL